jgi:hypothetical protein
MNTPGCHVRQLGLLVSFLLSFFFLLHVNFWELERGCLPCMGRQVDDEAAIRQTGIATLNGEKGTAIFDEFYYLQDLIVL